MRDPDDFGDRYVVVIGRWHFGPFPSKEGHRFAHEYGVAAHPLWLPDDIDATSQTPALVLALANQPLSERKTSA